MVNKEFFEALRLLEEERGIPQEEMIAMLEAGLTAAFKKISSSITPELMELTKKQCGELIGPVDDKVIGEIKTQLKDNKDTEESLISQGKFHNDKKKRNKEYINE